MARSLTIQHEEHARTSPLFTGFLLLSVAWLAANGLSTEASADVIDPGPSVQANVVP